MNRDLPRAVVMGASAGGLAVLTTIFSMLPEQWACPILVVSHVHPHSNVAVVAANLSRETGQHIVEAEDKKYPQPGTIYFAPANYHLLVERDGRMSLTVDPRVCYSRPSIDVLFETAAEAYGSRLTGIVLTGASRDGSDGLTRIRQLDGCAIIQDPATAESPLMPGFALDACGADLVLSPPEIGRYVGKVVG